MDDQTIRPINPRRRRKTKMEIFKEVYLPTIILGITVLIIVIFIIGALVHRAAPEPTPQQSTPAQTTGSTEDPNLAVIDTLLAQAQEHADRYDYDKAVAVLDSFQGDKSAYPALVSKQQEYAQAASSMVSWQPEQVTCLSFHTLIADPARAFPNKSYGTSYNRNFVTCGEFSKILDSLYEKGYILVSLDDYIDIQIDTTGHTTTAAKELKLPVGKKPLLLVQTNANYYTYMVDGDGDKEPDKDGAGFASKLILKDGKLLNEMVDASGSTVTGAYDLVPILEAFLSEHPDFSYNGARAILAPSGYDGAFGYRINASVKEKKGEDYFAQQVAGFTEVVNALKENGYRIGCYTYRNCAYGTLSAQEIQADLKLWQEEIGSHIGGTDILVYAKDSEIEEYAGSKFNVMQNAGYRCYIGIGTGTAGGQIGNAYYLQKRLPVTGSQMAHTSLYSTLFDASAVLDPNRGEVPN